MCEPLFQWKHYLPNCYTQYGLSLPDSDKTKQNKQKTQNTSPII